VPLISAPSLQNSPAVSTIATTRSKVAREEIKWHELFNHFRAVQAKHEKSRRMGHGSAGPLLDGYQEKRPAVRRGATTESIGMGMGMGVGSPTSPSTPSMTIGPRALSPLNPRSNAQRQHASLGLGGGMPGMGGQANGLLLSALGSASGGGVGPPRSMSPTLINAQKGRQLPRGLNLGRK
jgi:hypothetical protein